MTVDFIDVRPLADQVEALIKTVPNVNHYRGKVDPDPPKDPDGAVHAYTVLYTSPGRRFPTRLNAVPGALAWQFQVTCVGGDENRCLWCVDRVVPALTGVRLVLAGGLTGKIREPGDPGVVRRDDAVTPTRSYVPLLFGVHVAG